MLRIERPRIYTYMAVTLMLAVQGWGAGSSTDDTVKRVADCLRRGQVLQGGQAGLWPGEAEFMGATTAGMACAYQWTGDASYEASAQLGAMYSVFSPDAQGNLVGDVAYALVKLSEIIKSKPPGAVDIWWNWLVEFYDGIRSPDYEGSTGVYIHYFDNWEPSTSVFYIAYHVLATDYIADQDKGMWRDALIAHLSRVDDESACPVMALGLATWALARSGKLDDTPVASGSGSRPNWDGVMLRDLPVLLRSHQVPKGEPNEGSFYWRFDHAKGAGGEVAAGFTEDTVYGALGLVAAASLSKSRNEDVEQAIAAVDNALRAGVDADGEVYEHLSRQGATRYTFAGEMLQALWSVEQHRMDMQQMDAPTVEEGVTVSSTGGED